MRNRDCCRQYITANVRTQVDFPRARCGAMWRVSIAQGGREGGGGRERERALEKESVWVGFQPVQFKSFTLSASVKPGVCPAADFHSSL